MDNLRSLAATAATPEELAAAKQRREQENSKPIQPDRRVWRPQVTSQYREPDCIPDPLGDLEILHKQCGKPLWANKKALPPRNDILKFDPTKHTAELTRNLQWRDCPEHLRTEVRGIIEDYWDVFAEEGVRNHIRGVQFHVDTGEAAPICVRPPRYGPHETRVINDLIAKLEANGLIEDDDGPWGAPIVLAAKANQEHLHWSQYTWRLCVSYRKINAITRPFTFPVIRCDDAVKEIGNTKFFITMDLDSGYWQVPCEETSKAKLAFFTPTGKKRFRTMPMGATNAHPVFVALVAKFKQEWDALAKKQKLTNYCSQVIVDDIMISAKDERTLIEYFKCILQILQHYRCTAKLKKCRFFPAVAEFVGLDVHPEGNSPAKAKFEAFRKLGPPKTFTDLNMLIGCFGFYQEHLPLFEAKIKRWRATQKLRPPPGTPRRDERTILESAWDEDDDNLLEELKNSILKEPILKRPDSSLRFYLKTDWSKMAMGAALLQPDTSEEALKAMTDENKGEQCLFDLTKSGLRLKPIAFISRRTTPPERSYHSYVGEACAGIWAIEKFRPYLFGREFTWLTDCSGLRRFFEGDDIPTHMMQRWRMQLLRYDFTIVHRPGRMMFECDLLSRYNQDTEAWRKDDEQPSIQAMVSNMMPFSHTNPIIIGRVPNMEDTPMNAGKRKAQDISSQDPARELDILRACDQAIAIWTAGDRMNIIHRALHNLGFTITGIAAIDHDPLWRQRTPGCIDWQTAAELATRADRAPDWFVLTNTAAVNNMLVQVKTVVEQLAWKGLRILVLLQNEAVTDGPEDVMAGWEDWLRNVLTDAGWTSTSFVVRNADAGGATSSLVRVSVLGRYEIIEQLRTAQSPTTPILDHTERAIPIKELLQEAPEDAGLITTAEHYRQCNHDERHANEPGQSATIQLGDNRDWPVFTEMRVAPDLATMKYLGPRELPIVDTTSHTTGKSVIRELKWEEAAHMIGADAEWVARAQAEQWTDKDDFLTEIRHQPPIHATHEALRRIQEADQRTKAGKDLDPEIRAYTSMPLFELLESTTAAPRVSVMQTTINRWTAVPLPTHKKWAEATSAERDLAIIMEALQTDAHVERHRIANKKYHEAWEKGQLETEDGLLYHTGEPRLTQIRQLRRKVVPRPLRQLVITAYHATPLAGHSGIYRTYWRIAARYWWPRMYLDVKEAVSACAHCKLANAVGHEAKTILEALSCDTPFDIIAIDMWTPGAVADKYGNIKALTSLDTMTGFASAAILKTQTSEAIARACFATFFVPNGLPKLVLLDQGSENKGQLLSMCKTLGIKCHVVAPEDHNGILCERFHRYLNKVQKIGAANTQSYTQWAQNTLFATYSWNAAPIDGTNLIRSFVAKGRVFPFPIQVTEEANPVRIPQGQGEQAIAHLETNFPLWAKQSTLLQILIAERRERHRELANSGKVPRTFNIGDLVIVRKQLQSDADKGAPAKQRFRWKGIYKVLEKYSDNSYGVQKLPTTQGKGRPGRIRKYAAAVMEKVPSSLIINKHLDTSDTRLAALNQNLVSNPLEHNLGFYEYGKYVKAPDGANFAYDKVEDLWSIDISSDNEEDKDDTSPIDTLPEPEESNTEALYKRIADSRDKLVAIKVPRENSTKYDWYIAQVDWNESAEDVARKTGVYRLIWLVPNSKDSMERRRKDCRYWPEVHEVRRNGELGRMHMLNPTKATRDRIKKHGWAFYEWDVNLCQDLLFGPFNYVTIGKDPTRIPKDVWRQLELLRDKHRLDTSNINSVLPIT